MKNNIYTYKLYTCVYFSCSLWQKNWAPEANKQCSEEAPSVIGLGLGRAYSTCQVNVTQWSTPIGLHVMSVHLQELSSSCLSFSSKITSQKWPQKCQRYSTKENSSNKRKRQRCTMSKILDSVCNLEKGIPLSSFPHNRLEIDWMTFHCVNQSI